MLSSLQHLAFLVYKPCSHVDRRYTFSISGKASIMIFTSLEFCTESQYFVRQALTVSLSRLPPAFYRKISVFVMDKYYH